MNKFGVVLGIAAVATLAGCKDPDFKRSSSQNEPKVVDTKPAPVKTVEVEPVVPKCTCAPGTKHAKPCACGAPDCKCVVETKPVIVADVSKKSVEPEYTIYVVQDGDYLAKISKRFNVTISSIKRLNPSIKKDVILVGQKLKLPGKIDVPPPAVASGAASGTVAATVAKKFAKKSFAPYAGATKEYVVKSGDSLGKIALETGCTVSDLKQLNGLSDTKIRIGQKLKVPAEKQAVKAVAVPVVEKPVEKKVDVAEKPVVNPPVVDEAPVQPPVVQPPVADDYITYTVQEGDDITSVSIQTYVSPSEIRQLNNLGDDAQLRPGMVLKLPASSVQ